MNKRAETRQKSRADTKPYSRKSKRSGAPTAQERNWILNLIAGIIGAMRAIAIAAAHTDNPEARRALDEATETLNGTRRSLQRRYHGEEYEELEHD